MESKTSTEHQGIDPNNPEVMLVAGGIITPAIAAEAARYVTTDDFEDKRLSLIWGTLVQMINEGIGTDNIDVMTVASRCAKSAVTQRKIATFCSELLDVIPKVSSLVSCAQRIHRRATMRLAFTGLRTIAMDLKEQLSAPAGDMTDLEERMAHLSVGVSARSDTEMLRSTYKNVGLEVSNYFDQLATGPAPGTIATGLHKLDFRLGGGMRKGQMHVILGCSGSGKTALASQLCDYASSHDHGAVMFSMEVDPIDVHIRDVERVAGRSRWKLRSTIIAERESTQNDIVAAQSMLLSKTGGKVVYGERLSVEAIRQVVLTEALRSGPIDLVVVDHAQVALPNASEKRSMPRYMEVGNVAEGLRILARKLNVAVVLTAQMNPPPKGERPSLALVRESKDIVNAAEVAMMIWHEKEEITGGEVHVVNSWLLVDKVRAGQEGRVKVHFRGECYRFEEPHEEDEHV